MGVQGGHHREQDLQSFNGEPACERRRGSPAQARSSQRKNAFNPSIELHDTDATQARLGRDPEEREGEAIPGVCWISHLYRIGWECD